MFSLFKRKRKVILCLGGGAARAIANVGVLKVLVENKIPIDMVIGASMGALVGAGYCVGRSLEYMIKVSQEFKMEKITDVTLSSQAITKGQKLREVVKEILDDKSFKDCTIPFGIATTDINTGEDLLYTDGNLQNLVTASCSWPTIFPPVENEGRMLADGGIANSVPVKWAIDGGKNYIIAVKTGFEPQALNSPNMLDYLVQTIQIMGEKLERCQMIHADCAIEPLLHEWTQIDFNKGTEMIIRGVEAAEKIIPQLKKDLGL